MNDKIMKIGIVFMLLVFTLSFASAIYTRSNAQYTQFMNDPNVEEANCQQGQDFIIQIAPFGCEPVPVRSDLLEEQNVPVFCRLGATQINPLIDVEAIENIKFSGEYPDEIEGIAFHPARAALSTGDNSNNPILNNIGYAVIVLKQQTNASAMPDFVSGNLTAKVKYDVKNAFGVGDVKFYLPELDENEWIGKKSQYSFWNNRGYIRAEDVDADGAVISVYSGSEKVSSFSLEEGEKSGKISLPGFDCLANLEVKLNKLENPTDIALLRVNSDIVQVAKGEKFLDNKCQITGITKEGLTQEIKIKCNEDGGVTRFEPKISPRVNLTVGGVEGIYKIGDILHEFKNEDKRIFLGYIGQTEAGDEFIVPMISPERTSAKFLDSYVAKEFPIFIKAYTSRTGSIAMDALRSVYLSGGYGALKIVALAAITGAYPLAMYTKGSEGMTVDKALFDMTTIFARVADVGLIKKTPKIGFVGFAGSIDKGMIDDVDDYQYAVDDYMTISDSFSEESHADLGEVTFGEEALYNQIVLVWDAMQKKTVLELCEDFGVLYPNSDKEIEKYCKDDYKLSNQEIATNYVTINGHIKKIVFDGIYEPGIQDYGVKILVSNAGDYSGEKILGRENEGRVK